MNNTVEVYFEDDDDTGISVPTMKKPKRVSFLAADIPDEIRRDVNNLTANYSSKYAVEWEKICCFYNKSFPDIQYDFSEWYSGSYNARAHTAYRQERPESGTGVTANFIKYVVDYIVSRIGNTKWEYKLLSEQPTLIYAIYKDEIERLFKVMVKKFGLGLMTRGVFHDAAILGYAHVMFDPYTKELRKVNDYELGYYEGELNVNKLKRAVVVNFAFPVSCLKPYLVGFDEQTVKDIVNSGDKVQMRMYLDCLRKESYVIINNKCSAPQPYPFDTVQINTYTWDVGINAANTTSLFDLLFPIQREIDCLYEKMGVLWRNMKGPLLIFDSNVDIQFREMNNNTGEMAFVDTNKVGYDPASLVTTVNPTPLDPEMTAAIEGLKASMMELAGVQQISFDIENYRSAAALLAADQQKDQAFQSPLMTLAEWLRKMIEMYIHCCACMGVEMQGESQLVNWADIDSLLADSYLEVKPVHKNAADGGAEEAPVDLDYVVITVDQYIDSVIRKGFTGEDIPWYLDYNKVKETAAVKFIRLQTLSYNNQDSKATTMLDNLQSLLVFCFVTDVQMGQAQL